jgi:WD40 repeat protein
LRNVRVFISYARKDAADLAQQLQKQIAKAGLEPWLDTSRIDGGAVWTKDIEQAIDGCDVALALLSPGSYQSDICRAEQLRALRKGKRVIPILAKPGTDIPLHLETRNYRKPTQLKLILQDIQNRKSGVTLRTEFRETYVTAPPLPRNYVERPEEIDRLRQVLIMDEPGPSVAVTALRGMGGIGKTVLAQALAQDEAVRDAFPDGIAWCTVGKESTTDFVDRMREVRRALGDEPGDKETQLECVNRYRTLMAQKAALVIVDDVWRTEDIEPFVAESPRSRLLFTTRDGSIAAAVGADEQRLDVLADDKARELLARWAGVPVLTDGADDVIRECGGLPLALSMIGAMLRGKPASYWPHMVGILRQARLDKVSGKLVRAIQVSVEALDPRARERYLALAVLLEDMSIHPAIQQVLWNADEGDCLETAEQFVSLSLAQREEDGGGIRLHDLQFDYIRAQQPDPESLELIQGAVRLSSNVIARDPSQFVSQLVGRLFPYENQPAIRRFTSSLTKAAPKPWLRLLQPTLHPPGTALLRTLEGHSAYLNGAAVTPDGRRAVSASLDKTLKVWDLETGGELYTLEGHSDGVNAVVVSADGQRAVSASSDGTLKVWDLQTGRQLLALQGHSDWVNAVALSADGRHAVSSSSDKTLKVWNLETGHEPCTLKGHSDLVEGVSVSTDGRHAVSASSDKTLKVWDLESGRELRTLKGHSDSVTGVSVSPDGRRAVSASYDKTLKVWDLEAQRQPPALECHSYRVAGVAVSPDGQRAVSASWDTTLKVWDLTTGRELRTLEGHSGPVTNVAVGVEGLHAVSASHDKTLKVWDLETARELRTLQGHLHYVNAVAVNRDGRCAVSASADGTLRVWNLETGHELITLEGHSNSVSSVALSADGLYAVSASHDNTLKVWDLETGRELRTLQGHSKSVNGVTVSADGQLAVSASSDRTLKVWDLETANELRMLEGHSRRVNGVAVSPDGRLVVSASSDRTLKIWDLETAGALATFTADAAMRCCAFVGAQIILAGDVGGHVHFLKLENLA